MTNDEVIDKVMCLAPFSFGLAPVEVFVTGGEGPGLTASGGDEVFIPEAKSFVCRRANACEDDKHPVRHLGRN